MTTTITNKPIGTLSSRLVASFESCPRLNITLVDNTNYQRFRCLEPSLVSCLDQMVESEDTEIRYFIIHVDHQPAGTLSLVTQTNQQRRSPDNAYSRIDLVIVPDSNRRLGLGKVLVHSAILYALERVGWRLYSISCLAAHQAIEKILENFGFLGEQRADKGFIHEELKLINLDRDALLHKAESALKESIKQTDFRLRQYKGRFDSE